MNRDEPFVCTFDVSHVENILTAAGLDPARLSRAGFVDLRSVRAADLASQGVREHVLLGVSGWGALRQIMPLTRFLSARHISVILERLPDPSISESLFVPIQIGGRRGGAFQLQSDKPVTVHETLTRCVLAPSTIKRAPAHGVRVGLYDRSGEGWVAGDPHALHLHQEDLAVALQSDVAPLGDVVIASNRYVSSITRIPSSPPVLSLDLDWIPGLGALGPSWSTLATAVRSDIRWPRSTGDANPGRVFEGSPLPPVDTGSVNPVGFIRAGTDGYVTVGSGSSADHIHLRGPRDELYQLSPGTALGPEHIEALRGFRGVRDGNAIHHPGPLAHARLLSQLAAAGVPVIVERLPEAVKRLLGVRLAAIMSSADATRLADDFGREAHSVALRRVALQEHSARARWARVSGSLSLHVAKEPSVSVIVATRRPDMVRRILMQIDAQVDVDVEIVLALHGGAFDVNGVRNIAARIDAPVEIVEVASHVSLGEALNLATNRCTGDLVAKMDDDDWYGPAHLVDLFLALQYSGATLVGRPAEFIHLERIDVTVRRTAQGCENYTSKVPGAAMMLPRDALADIGGWRPTHRAVDRFLCQQVLDSGGRIYQTHGFGFLVSRRDDGHTWESSTNRFLRGAVAQWRGRRFDMATADQASAGIDAS